MRLWGFHLGKGTVLLIGVHSMSIALGTKQSFFRINSCYGFIFGTYIITDFITKCDSYFITNT